MARKPAFKRAAHRQCCVSIRQTTTVVVRGLGRVSLSVCLSAAGRFDGRKLERRPGGRGRAVRDRVEHVASSLRNTASQRAAPAAVPARQHRLRLRQPRRGRAEPRARGAVHLGRRGGGKRAGLGARANRVHAAGQVGPCLSDARQARGHVHQQSQLAGGAPPRRGHPGYATQGSNPRLADFARDHSPHATALQTGLFTHTFEPRLGQRATHSYT